MRVEALARLYGFEHKLTPHWRLSAEWYNSAVCATRFYQRYSTSCQWTCKYSLSLVRFCLLPLPFQSTLWSDKAFLCWQPTSCAANKFDQSRKITECSFLFAIVFVFSVLRSIVFLDLFNGVETQSRLMKTTGNFAEPSGSFQHRDL